MMKAQGRWFRVYEEILDDPKVQKLEPSLFKMWVNVLALASRNDGVLPPMEDCVFAFRETEDTVSLAFIALEMAGLLKRKNGRISPNGWEKRQYKTETSTERVKRFREKMKRATETPSESETESETEKKEKTSSLRSSVKKKKPPEPLPAVNGSRETHGTRLPAGWTPDDDALQWAIDQGMPPDGVLVQLDQFRDYWTGAPGQRGRKSDWPATWRNWIRKALERNGTGPPIDRAEAVRDAVRRAAIEADRRDAAKQQPEFLLPVEKPDGKPH